MSVIKTKNSSLSKFQSASKAVIRNNAASKKALVDSNQPAWNGSTSVSKKTITTATAPVSAAWNVGQTTTSPTSSKWAKVRQVKNLLRVAPPTASTRAAWKNRSATTTAPKSNRGVFHTMKSNPAFSDENLDEETKNKNGVLSDKIAAAVAHLAREKALERERKKQQEAEEQEKDFVNLLDQMSASLKVLESKMTVQDLAMQVEQMEEAFSTTNPSLVAMQKREMGGVEFSSTSCEEEDFLQKELAEMEGIAADGAKEEQLEEKSRVEENKENKSTEKMETKKPRGFFQKLKAFFSKKKNSQKKE